jgi:hypothetical protein
LHVRLDVDPVLNRGREDSLTLADEFVILQQPMNGGVTVGIFGELSEDFLVPG